MRARLLPLCALPLLVACQNADVRVTVSGIPDGATRLEVRTLANRVAPAEEGFVFDLPSGSVTDGSASFNLRMPADKYVEVSTVAFADACAVAAGSIGAASRIGVTDLALPLVATPRVCGTFTLEPDLVYISPGTFPLGASDTPVTLSGYAIERTEVMVSEYSACVAAGSCSQPRGNYFPTAGLPQVGLDWFQASAYCAWRGRRLPTEAEWERAARGPNGQPYPWGSAAPSCDRANYYDCNMATAPLTLVADLAAGASPEGVLNLIGNASEWVNDWDGPTFPRGTTDPQGPPSGTERVYRGGDFATDAKTLAATERWSNTPDGASPDPNALPTAAWLDTFGVRCARSLP